MKKLKITLVILSLGILSFNINAQNLVKAWKMSIDETMKHLPKEQQEEYNNASEEEKAMAKAMFEGIKFIFESNGTMRVEINMMGQEETKKGTWSLSNDGKTLTMTTIEEEEDENGEITSHEETNTVQVIESSAQKLILKNPEEKEMPVIAFVPADK